MKKSFVITLLGLALVLLAPAAAAAGGPWKVDLWQNGVPVHAVTAGAEFQVRGAGFHATVLPVKVCISGSFCTLANLQPGGEFIDTRTLTTPGTYQVTVYQARGINIKEWVPRVSETITVAN